MIIVLSEQTYPKAGILTVKICKINYKIVLDV